jgi:hypothetical protein
MSNHVPTANDTETITPGQIGKLQELLGAGLRKSGLPKRLVQPIIEEWGSTLSTKFVLAVQEIAWIVKEEMDGVNGSTIGRQFRLYPSRMREQMLSDTVAICDSCKRPKNACSCGVSGCC